LTSLAKVINILIISLLLQVFISCDDDDHWMPYVKVDERLHIHTDLAHLGIGGSVTVDGGLNGIIIYREANLVFLAFDRTCPYEPLHNCAVELEDELFAVCPCCNSRFVLPSEGMPDRGPATLPLKKYRTYVSGELLYITN